MHQEHTERANTWLLMAAVFVVSLHILLILSVTVSYLPSTYTWEVADMFARGRKFFLHKYDLILYRFWIITVLGLTISVFFIFKDRLRSDELRNRVSFFVLTTGFWLLLGYGAALELVLGFHHWLKIVLAFAILGNLLTWFMWEVRTDLLLSLQQRIVNTLGNPRNYQWFEYFVVAGNSNALFLRLSLVAAVVLMALNGRYLLAPALLPYYLPLRFALVGAFTASFALPIVFMIFALGALECKRIYKASIKASWYLTLAVCGLILFFNLYPIPYSSKPWPVPLGGRGIIYFFPNRYFSSGLKRSCERLRKILHLMGVSFLGGIQSGLVCVWIHERSKPRAQLIFPPLFMRPLFWFADSSIGCLTIPAVNSRFSKYIGH